MEQAFRGITCKIRRISKNISHDYGSVSICRGIETVYSNWRLFGCV